MVTKKSKIQKVEEYLNEKYSLRLNSLTFDIEAKPLKAHDSAYNTLNENDLFCELQKSGIPISLTSLTAILASNYVSKYNPISSYFMRIKTLYRFPNERDYIDELANHIEAENQERFNHHFKKMIVRSVACSLMNNVYNKQAFVLVQTEQNSGKSSFLRFLCPRDLKDYYIENIATDKDSLIALTENFIINLDELSTLRKADINAMKSIFSKLYVKARPPYGRKAINKPRIANFVGSTNLQEFLSDDSGSVRWLCFKIKKIDWSYRQNIDIDMVWSQALSLFHNKFEYELTKEEIAENEKENETFQTTSYEHDMLTKALEPGTKEEHSRFMTTADIKYFLEDYHKFKISSHPVQLGKALRSLGFQQSQKYNGHYNVKGYYVKIRESNL